MSPLSIRLLQRRGYDRPSARNDRDGGKSKHAPRHDARGATRLSRRGGSRIGAHRQRGSGSRIALWLISLLARAFKRRLALGIAVQIGHGYIPLPEERRVANSHDPATMRHTTPAPRPTNAQTGAPSDAEESDA